MKVIFRAVDVGYTEIGNAGAIKTIDEGVVSLAEMMMDTPGADDALEQLKQRQWVTLNWHTHFWGAPVAGADRVPDLVDESGNFRRDLVFRKDIDFEQMLLECRAEVEKCVRIYGKTPYATSLGENEVIARAKQAVCDEFGIIYNYDRCWHCGPQANGQIPGPIENPDLDPRYAPLNIYEYENLGRPGLTFESFGEYDPLEMTMTMPLDTGNIFVRSQHPAFVDDYILRQTIGNPDNTVSIHRLKDVQVLCSDTLKQWIIDNNIELINLRDAIESTSDYQNRLRATGSPLACRQMQEQAL